jgi:hypothetical protein
VFFGWGEIFSLFPSTLTDTFGTTYATANYGCLYMAQGVGSVLGGPVAAMLHQSTGSWLPAFAVIITMDFATAGLAIGVLKPMRQRFHKRHTRAPLPREDGVGERVDDRALPVPAELSGAAADRSPAGIRDGASRLHTQPRS